MIHLRKWPSWGARDRHCCLAGHENKNVCARNVWVRKSEWRMTLWADRTSSHKSQDPSQRHSPSSSDEEVLVRAHWTKWIIGFRYNFSWFQLQTSAANPTRNWTELMMMMMMMMMMRVRMRMRMRMMMMMMMMMIGDDWWWSKSHCHKLVSFFIYQFHLHHFPWPITLEAQGFGDHQLYCRFRFQRIDIFAWASQSSIIYLISQMI